jgi:hypothetical protein
MTQYSSISGTEHFFYRLIELIRRFPNMKMDYFEAQWNFPTVFVLTHRSFPTIFRQLSDAWIKIKYSSTTGARSMSFRFTTHYSMSAMCLPSSVLGFPSSVLCSPSSILCFSVTTVLTFVSSLFFFVSNVLTFVRTVFSFVSTVFTFVNTVFFFVSTVLTFFSIAFSFLSSSNVHYWVIFS